MAFRPHYFVIEERTVGDIRAAIAAVPGAEFERASRTRRCYLDTFDKRLEATGFVLEVDKLKNRCSLSLRRLGTEIIEWSLEMERPPRFGSDFDNPAIRAKVTEIIKARALMPDFSCDVDASIFKLVDTGGKTTARIIAERYSGISGKSDKRPLLPVIRIGLFKGYEAQARRAAEELKRGLPMQVCGKDYSRTIRETAGGVIPDYTAKPVPQVAPDDTVGNGMRKILGSYRTVMLANEAGMLHDIDNEFLHEFRVATRRSRSVFMSLKSFFPTAVKRRFKNEFGWLNRATGRHRDLDVFILKFDDYESMLGERAAGALVPLRELLLKERGKEHAKLIRTLKTKRYRRFCENWGETLEHLNEPQVQSAPSIHQAANRAIWRMYRRVAKRCPLIIDNEHMEPMHELRKDCKRLRYLIEAFQTIYPEKQLKRAVAELKALQDALGDLCDIHVQSKLLTQWGNRVNPPNGADLELHNALDNLKHTINKRGHKLFAELSVQLKRFNGTSNRTIYKRVFRPS